jgi:hypothetical protein
VTVYRRTFQGVARVIRVAAEHSSAAYDSNGDLYVIAGERGTLSRYAPGEARPRFVVRAGLRTNAYARVDSRRNVVVVDTPCEGRFSSNRILVYAPGASRLITSIHGVRRTVGVAVDRDGTLFEADEDCIQTGPAWVGVVPSGAQAPVERLTGMTDPQQLFVWPP